MTGEVIGQLLSILEVDMFVLAADFNIIITEQETTALPKNVIIIVEYDKIFITRRRRYYTSLLRKAIPPMTMSDILR